MIAVANLQYGWTLFVHPLHEKYGWSLGSIQTAFAIFVIAETWLVPFEGWFVDRFGPKYVVFAGGVLVGRGLVAQLRGRSLFLLYLGAALGGMGAGAVYGTCVGNCRALVPRPPRPRGRPHRRGLRRGLGAQHHPDPGRDRHERLRSGLPLVRPGAGPDRGRHRLGAARRRPRQVVAAAPRASCRPTRHFGPFEMHAVQGLLAALSHVHPGLFGRPHGYGPDRADRPRLQGRRRAGQPARPHPARAHLRHRPSTGS